MDVCHITLKQSTLVLLLVAIILLTSCADRPTTLRMALWVFPQDFDVLTAHTRFSATVNNYYSIIADNIFETLISTNFLGQPQSVLIDHLYFVKDSLIVVQIKEGVRFSDGSMLSTDDIIESAKRYYYYLPNKRSFDFSAIEPISDKIIHFSLNKENSRRFNMVHFSDMPIYKADYIRVFGDELLGELPLGTGPYYLYSASDTLIVLKKNRNNRDFANMGKNPDIIEYYYEQDLHNQYKMLARNEVDFIIEMEFDEYNDAYLDQNIKIYPRLSDSFSYLALDSMSPEKKDINIPQNPFQDKRVRQAIAHSIDIKGYIQNELAGQGIALVVPSPVQIRDYPTYLDYYTYDLDLARGLLKEAGLENGFKMSLFAPYGFYSYKLAQLVQASLKDINIEVEVQYFPNLDLISRLEQDPPSTFVVRYHITNPASRSLDRQLINHLNYKPGLLRTANFFKLYNPTINAHLDSLSTIGIDLNNREPIYRRAMEVVYEEVMVVPLLQSIHFTALRKDIVWNTKKNNKPLAKEFEMR